jgi:hypothetical protein
MADLCIISSNCLLSILQRLIGDYTTTVQENNGILAEIVESVRLGNELVPEIVEKHV